MPRSRDGGRRRLARRGGGGSPCRTGSGNGVPALEPASQLLVVEKLAVLGGPDRAVLVRERLVPALDVDDAKTPARAKATPGARKIPSSSGPRWTIASDIARAPLRQQLAAVCPRSGPLRRCRTSQSPPHLIPPPCLSSPPASRARARSDLRRCFSRRWPTADGSSRMGRRRTAESR